MPTLLCVHLNKAHEKFDVQTRPKISAKLLHEKINAFYSKNTEILPTLLIDYQNTGYSGQ